MEIYYHKITSFIVNTRFFLYILSTTFKLRTYWTLVIYWIDHFLNSPANVFTVNFAKVFFVHRNFSYLACELFIASETCSSFSISTYQVHHACWDHSALDFYSLAYDFIAQVGSCDELWLINVLVIINWPTLLNLNGEM